MRRFIVIMLLIVLAGCARTTVKKVVTGTEKGVRYYRTKPYLFIAPDAEKDKVVIKIEHLPDVSEEYAIHVHAGTGTNNTQISLNENGTLKSLNIDVDSQFDENIKALTDAFTALPKGGATPTGDSKSTLQTTGISVPAHRVPLGLYESVISRDPECGKRIYAWKYIGFAPFTQCPMESGGVYQTDCSEQLYGLIFDENNVMVFAPLTGLANENVRSLRTAAPAAVQSNVDSHKNDLLDAINDSLDAKQIAHNLRLRELETALDRAAGTLTISVKGVPPELRKDVKQVVDDSAAKVYGSLFAVTSIVM